MRQLSQRYSSDSVSAKIVGPARRDASWKVDMRFEVFAAVGELSDNFRAAPRRRPFLPFAVAAKVPKNLK